MKTGTFYSRSGFVRLVRSAVGFGALFCVLATPSLSTAEESDSGPGRYHTYHNVLGGNLIASAACARESSEPGATTTRLDVVDEVLGVSTTAPAFWVYDGVRTWTVQKTLFLGRYHRYQNRDSDCVVYTNSASAEFLLAIFSVGGVPWYSAAEYSVPRLTLVE